MNMNKILLLMLLCVTVTAPALMAQESITVLAGQQKIIDVAGATDVYVGDANIAKVDIHRNQRQAIITGRSAGITSLTVVYSSGKRVESQIEVLTRLPEVLIREVKDIFGEIEGVTFRKVGAKTIASGELLSYSDRERLDQILALYPEILDLTADKTERPMIGLTVSIIEVSRTKSTDYNPQDPVTGLIVQSGEGTASGNAYTQGTIENPWPDVPYWFWGVNTDIFSKLAYWVSKGRARLIANPKFSVSDGDSATFHSGGEIPFEYQTRDGLAIEWKEYGIIINVRPKLLGSGSVFLDINAEASSLDRQFAASQSGIPAIIKRKISNNATIKRGNTLVLAGIYQLQESEVVKRVPILGHLLPFLFSSINKEFEVKEIMILVTPTAPPDIDSNQFPMIQQQLRNQDR
ncbi:pilus assembly protein N-terminal domain-containing protein [candidate division KSB1 bacterium]|nr:pilus assembly protein N-terminal domain-containing protein [candidate division KSB1 bacterium]